MWLKNFCCCCFWTCHMDEWRKGRPMESKASPGFLRNLNDFWVISLSHPCVHLCCILPESTCLSLCESPISWASQEPEKMYLIHIVTSVLRNSNNIPFKFVEPLSPQEVHPLENIWCILPLWETPFHLDSTYSPSYLPLARARISILGVPNP